MPFQIGEVVADYEILEVLGQGGMGAVYRVRNVLSYREEAMKQVLPHIASNAETADRFLREIRIQASLQHPNIAALHTAIHVKEGILMIMELVDGHSVEAMVRKGPIAIERAIRIADDILGALVYAHARGIIHRDIKPANILITSRGMPKLTDFGIARAANKEMITRSGIAIGSPHYMSPEQVMSKTADERSDVYSLGVTLYEMLTGRRPIDGENDYAVMNAHLVRDPEPPNQIVPSISDEISAVVMKSLAKEPSQRYATASGFQAALREAVFGGQGTVEMPRPLDPEEIARVEAPLKEILGPIAKSLITKEARSGPYPEFVRRLAEQIPTEADRAKFLKATGAVPASRSGSRTGGGQRIEEATVTAARKALAQYLGPIASVVATKAANGAKSLDDFHAALAREIPDEKDRKAFLSSLARK